MKKIILTVTTDLSYDQRMKRICTSLNNAGFNVLLVGRKRKISLPLHQMAFMQIRLNCLFEKGKLFYAEYNIRLFFFLLFNKADIICSIDLDTILPGFAVSRLKNIPLVYDAHEYFTEMEEVVSRPYIKKIWQFVERITVPHLKYAYTVSEGYAKLFYEKYKVKFEVIRNATVLKPIPAQENLSVESGCYILYQGAVNVGRGLEELLVAMQTVNSKLIICGNGDVFNDLPSIVEKLDIKSKIMFTSYLEPEKLHNYTRNASIGLTLFSNNGLSNQFSLANRFFDYMHCGVPQIAMNYPGYANINSKFKIAELIDDLKPETIAAALNKLLSDKDLSRQMSENALLAREEYNWQNEEKKLISFYASLFLQNKNQE